MASRFATAQPLASYSGTLSLINAASRAARGRSLYMGDPPRGETPDALRERAEQCFRLARGTTDGRAHDALIAYGRELLEEAKALLKDPK